MRWANPDSRCGIIHLLAQLRRTTNLNATTMAKLPDTLIYELCHIVLVSECSRDALLLGLDSQVTCQLPTFPRKDEQILSDLHRLNSFDAFDDRPEPLLTWLTNAKMLTVQRFGCDRLTEYVRHYFASAIHNDLLDTTSGQRLWTSFQPTEEEQRSKQRLTSKTNDTHIGPTQSSQLGRVSVSLADAEDHYQPIATVGDSTIACLLHRPKGSRGWSAFSLKPSGSVIGRLPTCDIVLHDERISKRHCRIAYSSGLWMIFDLGSQSGTIVNNLLVTDAQHLQMDAQIRIDQDVFRFYTESTPRSLKQAVAAHLTALRDTDPLTGLATKEALVRLIEDLIAEKQHHHAHLAILHIDQASALYNTLGTTGCDILLYSIGKALTRAPRHSTLGRLDEWEFFAVIYAPDQGSALQQVKDLNSEISRRAFEVDGRHHKVSVSVGLTTIGTSDNTAHAIISRARRTAQLVRDAGGDSTIYCDPLERLR